MTFPAAAEMLDIFGIGQGRAQYRRPIGAFERVFDATIFFRTDDQARPACKLPVLFRVRRPHWISTTGCGIDATLPCAKNAFLCSAHSG